VEILIRQHYSPSEIWRATLKRLEFRPTRYTSGCANLDNMIELGKAVVLCEAHARKFSPKRARYMAHPDKNLRRVHGHCDVCREPGLHLLFLNEKDGIEEHRKLEKFKRCVEYGHSYNG
jgi:hypothetical protein